RFSTGSPGIRWISANASSVTPKNVGMISARRRRAKRNIGYPPRRVRARASRRRQIDLVEIVVRRRVHLVAAHLLAQCVEAHRMRDWNPRRLVVHDHLRLLVELRAVGLLRRLRRLDDEVLERLVAPARVVAAALDRLAAQERDEKVVGIAVVAGPAEHHDLMLATLRALAVLGPFVGDELRAHADLSP